MLPYNCSEVIDVAKDGYSVKQHTLLLSIIVNKPDDVIGGVSMFAHLLQQHAAGLTGSDDNCPLTFPRNFDGECIFTENTPNKTTGRND